MPSDLTDPTRNHARRPGDDFRDAVWLDGWEDQSVWGYDEGCQSFFAQLWRNGTQTEHPDVWLAGVAERYPWPGCLALAVLDATGADPGAVINALGLAEPHPVLRDPSVIAAARDRVAARPDDPYGAGSRDALSWLLGQATVAPGSRWRWMGGLPTAPQAVAEHHFVTGRVYRENTPSVSGADSALWWALGHDDQPFP